MTAPTSPGADNGAGATPAPAANNFSSFMLGLAHSVTASLLGIVGSSLADFKGTVERDAADAYERLLTAVSAMGAGSSIVREAEGWVVKVVGGGLPAAIGAGSSLLQALEQAVGLPSTIQTTPPAGYSKTAPTPAIPPEATAPADSSGVLQALAPAPSLLQRAESALVGDIEQAGESALSKVEALFGKKSTPAAS